jgi:hypothetical protein
MNYPNLMSKEIEKKIHYKRSNTLFNHLKTIWQLDPLKYSGNLRSDELVIWRYSRMSGIFYPVIYGRITNNDGQIKINLKARLNIVGSLLLILIGVIFFLSWFFGSHLSSDEYSFEYWIRKIGIGILFGSIPVVSIRLIFGYVKRGEFKSVAKMVESIE